VLLAEYPFVVRRFTPPASFASFVFRLRAPLSEVVRMDVPFLKSMVVRGLLSSMFSGRGPSGNAQAAEMENASPDWVTPEKLGLVIFCPIASSAIVESMTKTASRSLDVLENTKILASNRTAESGNTHFKICTIRV
jgi:hypothetical protein